MPKNELEKIWDLPSELPYRERVDEIQELFQNNDLGIEVELNDGGNKAVYPSSSKYNHYFSSGLYIREMFVAADIFGFTGIHNLANPLFVMKGVMWCSSEQGVQKLVAPTFVLTEPGTKRICWFPEDSIVMTVHPNPEGLTDLDEIEKKYFSMKWEPKHDYMHEDWKLFKHKEYHKKIKHEQDK